MSLVQLRDVSLAFGDPPLLEGVDLIIEPGERLGLVGRNGVGKTTLMKLILGEVLPDDGEVDRGVGVEVAYLPQEVPLDLQGRCDEVVAGGLRDPASPTRAVDQVLSRLELDGAAETATLSGGLKRRVLLARALVREPDLLLLDEPTNHLDIDSIVWLERFLTRHDGALLFITHDRVFLQRLATRIVDLDRGKMTSWPGRFDQFVSKKQEALEVEQRQQANFDKKLAREETWVRKGIKARRTRNEGRVRALSRLREEAKRRRSGPGNARIHVQEARRSGRKVVRADGVSFAYGEGDPPILERLSTTIYRGDNVGIIGRNGCGKTTLLKLLTGELAPSSGELELGDNLEVAYLDQLRETLDEERTVAENVVEQGDQVIVDGAPKHIYTYLKDFLFAPERARTPVSVLSGGEKNRLLLAKLFTLPANVLVLDEPTNNLDTETLELLEARVVEFGGTVLLVSHNRAFLNNTVTSTMVFEGDGVLREYAGGYDDWLEQREPVADEQPARPRAERKPPRARAEKPRRLGFNEQRELEALPGEIERLEQEQTALHERLADPELYRSAGDEVVGATERLEQIEAELACAYDRWAELEEIREASLVKS